MSSIGEPREHQQYRADRSKDEPPVLFSIVKDGIEKNAPPGYESDMPAFAGTLSDAEIWAALAYIKSRWPEEIQRRHDARERSAGN